MSTKLPNGFLEQLASLLGSELPSFVESYRELPMRGLRVRENFKVPDDAVKQVPWAERGYYVPLDTLDGAAVAHEAGAYYMQEPSAMTAAAVLHPLPGDRVLDLCAAPGGKSTQLAAYMKSQGTLVCNEPHPARAQILSGNIERMGIPNAVVVSALPEKLCGPWQSFFDRILVDAPCSGEGMFRRHPESREEWDVTAPERCAERQKGILHSASLMLRAGGFMVYSTCTFNRQENEGTILSFLSEHDDFELVPFSLPGFPPCDGMLRVWPHRIQGEGHFAALLHKKGNSTPAPSVSLPLPDKIMLRAFEDFNKIHPLNLHNPLASFGASLVCVPDDLPPLKGIKVLRAGLHVGQLKGKVFAPDHALSHVLKDYPCYQADEKAARAYLHGETIACDENLKGWLLVSFQNMPLGWGKASGGQIKNHYPKGLRK